MADPAVENPGMNPPSSPAPQLSWWPRAGLADRFVQTLIAAGAWLVLVVAFHLQPSPDGLGTHQQLGLQPCAFYQMTGRPCPACGMTTAFAHLAHGQIWQGIIVQPFGALLFVLTLAAALATTATATAGRSWNLLLSRWLSPTWVYTAVVLGLAGWTFKVVYGQVTGGYSP
jgi:hypothetical protein